MYTKEQIFEELRLFRLGTGGLGSWITEETHPAVLDRIAKVDEEPMGQPDAWRMIRRRAQDHDMSRRRQIGYRVRSSLVLVLAACIGCAVVYWFEVDAGWQAIAILVVISTLLRLAWVTIIKRATLEHERQARLAMIMWRQPDQNHEWDRR
jgi:hypothetical protein